MKQFFAVLIVAAMAFSLTACQPTPETPPVVNRSDENLLAAAIEPAEEGTVKEIDAPERWEETVQLRDGFIEVVANTDVMIPEVSNTPVYELAQKELTEQRLSELIHYFCGNEKIYKIPPMTKKEVEELLTAIENGEGEFGNIDTAANYRIGAEKLLETAPEQSAFEEVEIKFTEPQTSEADVIASGGILVEDELKAENTFEAVSGNEEAFAYLHATKYDTTVGSSSCFEYSNGYIFSEDDLAEEQIMNESYKDQGKIAAWAWTGEWAQRRDAWFKDVQGKMDSIMFDEAAAIEIGDQVIADLGIENVALESCKAGLHIPGSNYTAAWALNNTEFDTDAATPGYELTYCYDAGGLLSYNFYDIHPLMFEQAGAPAFLMEEVTIFVTEDGIQAFKWDNMCETVGIIAENTELLPFEECQVSLLNDINYCLTFEGSKIDVEITHAELRAANTPAKDAPEHTWITPAWLFTYEAFITTDEETGRGMHIPDLEVLISAIDGSVIMNQ